MIRKGYTVNYQLPVRLITFFAYPTSHYSFWFEPKLNPMEMRYPDGRISWKQGHKSIGAVYYDNGEPAVSFVFGKTGPLVIVYTKSKQIRDRIIKPVPVALFDTKGNGIVYDKKTGKKRLIYDQAQGIWLDSPSKYPIPWKWRTYDQVKCRRAELKFVSPTIMDNFDYDRKMISLKNSESTRGLRLKSKKSTLVYEVKKSKTSKTKKKSRRIQNLRLKNTYNNKLLIKSNSERSNVSFNKSTRPNSIIRDIDAPKILRFVGSGFIIKPALTPCSELEPIKANIASLCSPHHLDSTKASDKPSQEKSTSKRGTGQKTNKEGLLHSDDKLFREPLTRCKHRKRTKCLLKPIVLEVTDKVSLTITDQEHIHLDFISPPVHYYFNIGVIICVEKLDSVFDVRISKVDKDYIPSVLEALKMKCPILHEINNTITNLKKRFLQKSRRDCIKSLKAWGQDKYLGKVPLCKLMNNECNCRSCTCIPIDIKI
nr:uncharacterized protein LOC106680460 [Halyomorpha halys]